MLIGLAVTLALFGVAQASPVVTLSASVTALPSAASTSLAPYPASNSSQSHQGTATATYSYVDTSLAPLPPRASSSQPPLLPAVHWENPTWDIRNLGPQCSHDLYYSSQGISDPTLEHMFSKVTANLTSLAVVLDHSSFVQSVSCTQSGIQVAFTNASGYAYAKQSWSSAPNFMLVTYTDSCGVLPNTRSFWEVKGLSFDDVGLSITANVQEELGIETVIYGVNMTWGTWNAVLNNTSSSGPYADHNNTHCGAPPSETIDGFPAMACNDPNFDNDVDSSIGYLDCDEAHTESCMAEWAPGLNGNDTDPEPTMPNAPDARRRLRRQPRARRSLMRRDAQADAAKVAAEAAAKKPKGPLEAVGDFFNNIGKEIKNAARDIIKFNPEVSSKIPIDIKAPDDKIDKNAPWPKSATLVKADAASSGGSVTGELSVFCVNCFMKGEINVAGRAEWNIVDGLKALEASTNGNIDSQLAIGLVAQAEAKQEFTADLFRLTPPPPAGFSLPGLIDIGPFLQLSAKAEVSVTIKGQVLAGLTMKIPDFKGKLDFLDASKSTKEGFEPQFEKIFEANAEVAATAGIGLPVAIGIGVNIPPLKFKKDAELVDKPSLESEFKFSTDGVGSCKGIDWNIKFKNDLYFNAFDLKRFDINTFVSPALAEGCLDVPGSAPTVTSSTVSETESASATESSSATDSVTATDASSTEFTATDASSTSTEAPSSTDGASTTDPTSTDGSRTEASSSGEATSSTTEEATTTAAARKRAIETTPTTLSKAIKAVRAPRQLATFPTLSRRQSNFTLGFNSSDFTFSNDDNTDFNSTDFAEFSQLASESEVLNANSTGGDAPGTTFITIQDYSQNFQLVADSSGNLRPAAPGVDDQNAFMEIDGLVFGDDNDRFLHYYPDTMDRYGVSRIRMSAMDSMPLTADFVGLAPAPTGNSSDPDVYAAVDSQDNAYFLLTCNYEKQASKLFIAKDGAKGEQILKQTKLRYTVTGGVVSSCGAVPWAVPAADVDGW